MIFDSECKDERLIDCSYREFEDKFRSLCQFMTASEHESLINSLHKEHDLRRRVKELTRFRNNGITSFDDCIQFNQLTLARQSYKASVSDPVLVKARSSFVSIISMYFS